MAVSKDRNIPQKRKNFQVSSKIETKVVSCLSRKEDSRGSPLELGEEQPISVAWWFVSRRRRQCIGQCGTQVTGETTHALRTSAHQIRVTLDAIFITWWKTQKVVTDLVDIQRLYHERRSLSSRWLE